VRTREAGGQDVHQPRLDPELHSPAGELLADAQPLVAQRDNPSGVDQPIDLNHIGGGQGWLPAPRERVAAARPDERQGDGAAWPDRRR
jgi:hypothetical protein